MIIDHLKITSNPSHETSCISVTAQLVMSIRACDNDAWTTVWSHARKLVTTNITAAASIHGDKLPSLP
jgi:hypothetical protein